MLTAVLTLFANIHMYKVRKKIKSSYLDSYIKACCVWMFFLFAMTELLSLFHIVRFIAIFSIWVMFDLVMLAVLAFQIKAGGYKIGELYSKYKKMITLREHPYYAVLFLIGAVALVLAICTTPNNWDSMTYHLSRIVHWVQNRSVEHYATGDVRQLSSPMLGEFVNLHVYILCRHKEILINVLQAGSYITCALLVGAIAGKLGCDKFYRFLAALLYMTTPIAFAEALTTQVDNFATVWLLFYVYELLDLVKADNKLECKKTELSKVSTLALCVAWGYLAKPSVCIAMVIFAVWLLIKCIVRKDKIRNLFSLAFYALPYLVVPLVPEILRNFMTFHAYASPQTGARQLVGTLQPSYLLVNFIKNFTFNFPVVLIKNSHNYFATFARNAAKNLNVDLNAVSISEEGGSFFLLEAGNYGHDTALNPIVMWLTIFCVLWALYTIRKTDRKSIVNEYLVVSVISFCIFCTVLRWEPFVTRYMVSYLALLCPMIASQIKFHTGESKSKSLRDGIIGIVCFLCIMEAISMTAYHYNVYAHEGANANNRPYVYFLHRKDKTGYYAALTDAVKSQMYSSVGLHIGSDEYEYPIWKMLEGQRIEHVNVNNESAIYADRDFVPECIIWIDALPEEPVIVNNQVYTQIEDFGEYHYFLWK